REFPNSVVHLRLIGDKIIVAGQAFDPIEETNIIRFVRGHAPSGEVKNMPRVPAKDIPTLWRREHSAGGSQVDRAGGPVELGNARLVTAASWATVEPIHQNPPGAANGKAGPRKQGFRVIQLTNVQAADVAKALVELFAHDKSKDLAIVA